MTSIAWGAFGIGALAGAAVGTLFFVGLALGMRLALRSVHATPILLFSGALRIGVLLVVGWRVAQSGSAALVGFILAFVTLRFVAIAIARRPLATERLRWN